MYAFFTSVKSNAVSVEKHLNSVVQKRKIYSGIYQTAFGAYPVILSDGDLPLSANLQDYEGETYEDEDGNKLGAYHYYVTAYSPDGGTLSATWFQDIYGDDEEHVQVLDPEGKLITVVKPEEGSPNGNYTFGFVANKAGSYYAVISNTNPENGTIRNVQSNGSIIEHASEFTLKFVCNSILFKKVCNFCCYSKWCQRYCRRRS